ncbi:hypothetical protein LQ567_16990 [Niabella pedocola]|uniref:Uncharacterized protein n=1 Tax=Niabella pedocola TaxID=1752077 RepID=A0ABS8PTS4_9BACT|nr:hypothetical protein [Niabella pedocola]MCD2424479.1 hypothetical protein [Niabella pedocola]
MLKRFLIKNISKPSLIIALLCTGLTISLTGNIRKYQQKKASDRIIQQLLANNKDYEALIQKKYRDAGGSLHTVIKEVTVQNEAGKLLSVGNGYLDTVTRALKIATAQIDELTKINGQATARIKLLQSVTEPPDGQQVSQFGTLKSYADPQLQIAYDHTTDSLFLNYKIDLNVIKYHKRKNILAPMQYYVDIYSNNPRVMINHVKRFSTQIVPRTLRFGIGPQIGAMYNPQTGKLQAAAGIGLQYNLIRF